MRQWFTYKFTNRFNDLGGESIIWFVYVAVFNLVALHNIYFLCLWQEIACLCWKCH